MCTQWWNVYACGCRQKRQFEQCQAKYNGGSNLQCARTDSEVFDVRNYCSNHLPKDNKARTKYVGRQANN